MGSEHMWLLRFRKRSRTKAYREFKKRYLEFHPEDIVPLCVWHHDEIHGEYVRIIRDRIALKDYRPLHDWTWEEANELMAELRKYCRAWLDRETPGSMLLTQVTLHR